VPPLLNSRTLAPLPLLTWRRGPRPGNPQWGRPRGPCPENLPLCAHHPFAAAGTARPRPARRASARARARRRRRFRAAPLPARGPLPAAPLAHFPHPLLRRAPWATARTAAPPFVRPPRTRLRAQRPFVACAPAACCRQRAPRPRFGPALAAAAPHLPRPCPPLTLTPVPALTLAPVPALAQRPFSGRRRHPDPEDPMFDQAGGAQGLQTDRYLKLEIPARLCTCCPLYCPGRCRPAPAGELEGVGRQGPLRPSLPRRPWAAAPAPGPKPCSCHPVTPCCH
jgi:hypothetical protein